MLLNKNHRCILKCLHEQITYHSGTWTENNFLGEHKVITPEQQIPRYNFIFIYVFRMAMAIAFLCENAVEAI